MINQNPLPNNNTVSLLENVRDFWENNPLFAGESRYEVGSRDFFEEHKKIYFDDFLNRSFDHNLYTPRLPSDARVLDLGCGIGFWTVELSLRGHFDNIWGADLTKTAIQLTGKRLSFYGLKANLSMQNAENMSFSDLFFDHVHCFGVLHHTPNPQAAIKEIARVLKKDGSALISVYHTNVFLKFWPFLSGLGAVLCKKGIYLKGRGRENMLMKKDPKDIVRLYDGKDNPIGISYTKEEIIRAVEPYFTVESIFLTYFPTRFLPFKVPVFLRRFLAKKTGFLINLRLRKK